MANKNPYKDTIFLPKTDFSMRANLTQNEPIQLKSWEDNKLYDHMVRLRKGKTPFVLHDGPPYANGNIHHGHCLNKILKDIIVKFKHLTGFQVNYIPGWDCHGLPIEHEVEKKEKASLLQKTPRPEIRKRCRDYATKFVSTQKEQFKRLGVLGEWDQPYITMDATYEAKDLQVLAKFVKDGLVYKKKRPVHWCGVCQTSLAGSEVEYKDIEDDSIFVMCSISPQNTLLQEKLKNASVVFWTTTPWSTPAVLAISIKKDAKYGIYETPKGKILISTDLKSSVESQCGLELSDPIHTFQGSDLEGTLFTNPLTEKDIPIILGDHVSLETGTGCVSTAPGHGEDDYAVGLKYNLDVYCPVNKYGKFDRDVKAYEGLSVFNANPKIIEDLETQQHLLGKTKVSHSYPHCWRSKNPAVLRATEQWFIDVDKSQLRKKCIHANQSVSWTPAWSQARMKKMLETRPDWCISRQRAWGVPIPSLYCTGCETSFLTEEICLAVAEVFQTTGADAWDMLPIDKLIPETLQSCPSCGSKALEKENNILDVWFDSGISFEAVIKERLEIETSDLYLEGNDQYRGWFQSSLLTSCGWQNKAPYKNVVVHGMILDAQGHKYSKSSANFEPPEIFIKNHGADVMRLWVASENFHEDMTFSAENIKRVVEVYRKLRNTLRFMMGVVEAHSKPPESPQNCEHPLHQYMFAKGQAWLNQIVTAYGTYSYNKVFHLFNQFMTTELSGFYLDICKDSLYCDLKVESFRQEAVQVISWLSYVSIHALAPITSFLSEDAYSHFPLAHKPKSIFLSETLLVETPLTAKGKERIEHLEPIFEAVHALRNQVQAGCELLRAEKKIKTNAQAHVSIHPKSIPNSLHSIQSDLALYLGISEVEISEKASDIEVAPSQYQRCERCWNFRSEVGTLTAPDLCKRCHNVIITLESNPT
jgi:isoleucyl-tRNA synthetase